jgi:hypothetical protein
LQGGTRNKYSFGNTRRLATSSAANSFEWIDGIGIGAASFFESSYTLDAFYNNNGYVINKVPYPFHTNNNLGCTATIGAYSPSVNVWKLYNIAPRLPHTRTTWVLPVLNYPNWSLPYGNLYHNRDTLTLTFPMWSYSGGGSPTAVNSIAVSLYVWNSTAHCMAKALRTVGTNSVCNAMLIPVGQIGEDTVLLRNISQNASPQTVSTVTNSNIQIFCDSTSNQFWRVAGSNTDFLYTKSCVQQVGAGQYVGGLSLGLNDQFCQSNFRYINGSRTCDGGNCVYPGDTNRDSIVNHLDFLPIWASLNMGVNPRSVTQNGASYNYGTMDWRGQIAPNAATNTQINSDCDGSGGIYYNDTMAIVS